MHAKFKIYFRPHLHYHQMGWCWCGFPLYLHHLWEDWGLLEGEATEVLIFASSSDPPCVRNDVDHEKHKNSLKVIRNAIWTTNHLTLLRSSIKLSHYRGTHSHSPCHQSYPETMVAPMANHTVRVMVLSRAYSLQPLIPPRVCSGSDLPFREKPAKFDNIKDVV